MERILERLKAELFKGESSVRSSGSTRVEESNRCIRVIPRANGKGSIFNRKRKVERAAHRKNSSCLFGDEDQGRPRLKETELSKVP